MMKPRGLTSLQKLLHLNCPELDIIACCSSAEEAREQIVLLKPHLVFLDIAMPGKSGLDLLYDMTEINFEIIFVTAHVVYDWHFRASIIFIVFCIHSCCILLN